MGMDSFCRATSSDAEQIAQLVNSAYRPKPGAAGWTHEADLVCGDRVNAAQVVDKIAKPDSAVLIGRKGSEIVACIHVEKVGDESHLGMFAVTPGLQGGGMGKQLLAYSERYAGTTFAAKKFVMLVISARSDLIAFYIRRGYRQTALVMEYPLLVNAGIPKCDGLQVIVLNKDFGND
ncbi:MAG: GNAT family N-acetyltransferase [Pseudomonadota bacterium]|nr:GNAT family N-acetyltransferase [Pseudomonadota bacterium]